METGATLCCRRYFPVGSRGLACFGVWAPGASGRFRDFKPAGGANGRHRGLLVLVDRKAPSTSDEYTALKRVTVGTPLHFAIILGWATGLRLSDVCLITWDSVDLPGL